MTIVPENMDISMTTFASSQAFGGRNPDRLPFLAKVTDVKANIAEYDIDRV